MAGPDRTGATGHPGRSRPMDTVTVRFPLPGDWVAVHTPAHRIPSHGFHLWGQTYAYDFLRVQEGSEGFRFHTPPTWRYWLGGVRLEQCLGHGAPILAPFSGEVVEAHDGWPERQRLHPVVDVFRVLKNGVTFDPRQRGGNVKFVPMLGNYLILRHPQPAVYALLAHLRPGSVRVRPGQRVTVGEALAQVGHTGNSTAPHLHFQLMDRVDLRDARGIPCAFDGGQWLQPGGWEPMRGAIPGRGQPLRGDSGSGDPEA
jgi:murein DD-endopeptidase MepM/ murein hydrolase activator NlpD